MRTVREEPDVEDAVDDARERWSRADEAWDAIVWALSHDPYVGTPLTEGGSARAFTLVGKLAYDMPTITVLYEIDPQYVTIRSARFVDANRLDS